MLKPITQAQLKADIAAWADELADTALLPFLEASEAKIALPEDMACLEGDDLG